MRRLIVLLFVAMLASAQGTASNDLRLNDGTVLRAARIILITSDKVTIVHAGGMLTTAPDSVPLDELARASERLAASAREREQVRSEVTARDTQRRAARMGASVEDLRPRISDRTTLGATGDYGPKTTPENGCVFASNARATGTGFVLRQADGFVLVSNQHVIDGPAPLRFELPGKVRLKPYGGFLAEDRDIVVFDLEESSFDSYFELEPSVDAVALGEDVIIYGDSDARGMRISRAKLVAKNRDQIEVSGGIVPGNSGGPILRAKTGRVIGVSTYVYVRRKRSKTIEDVVLEATLPDVQYYGVRIDTLGKTSPFHLAPFVNDSTSLQRDENRLDDAMALLVLLLSRSGAHLSSDLRKIAASASEQVQEIAALYRRDRLAFRRRADPFFTAVSTGASYRHRETQARLSARHEILSSIYREILGR